MPYEFEPRDLDEPTGARSHETPSDELADAFEQWLADAETIERREIGGSVSTELYELAEDVLADVDVRARDATALLLERGSDLEPTVGLFLSAAYNSAGEDVAVFDVDVPTPVKHLGFRLRPEKTLVLDGRVGSAMASEAAGLVVNRTDVDSYFGYSAQGAFVNAPDGSCLTFGAATAGVAVDLGTVTGESGADVAVALAGADGDERVTIAADDLSEYPAVADYLDRLADGLTGDRDAVRACLADMEPTPRAAIERELRRRIGTE